MDNIGPGLWYGIHRLALDISSQQDMDYFEQYLIAINIILPCEQCKQNYSAELSNIMSRLPNSYNSYKTALSAFSLTVDLHNRVNIRLNKTVMDYPTALKLHDPLGKYENILKSQRQEIKSPQYRSRSNRFPQNISNSQYSSNVHQRNDTYRENMHNRRNTYNRRNDTNIYNRQSKVNHSNNTSSGCGCSK